MKYRSGFDTDTAFTSNQPLLFGGQLYMWNRWLNVKFRSHGVHDQYTKGPQSRAYLWSDQKDGPHVLSAPVGKHKEAKVSDLRIVNPEAWIKDTARTFDSMYGKYYHYKVLNDDFKGHLNLAKYTSLAEFNLSFFTWVYRLLTETLPQPEIIDDDLCPRLTLTASQYVAALTKAAGASVYLGGGTARKAYISDDDFVPLGVRAEDQYFSYEGPRGEDGSICVLDQIFAYGPKYVKSMCLVDPCTQVQTPEDPPVYE